MSSIEIVLAHKRASFMDELKDNLDNSSYTITQKSKRGIPLLRNIIKTKPDIAIIDYELDDISAFDIIQEARSKKVDTKFFVLYPKATRNDLLVSKTLHINGNVNQSNSISKITSDIEKVVKGDTVNSAFKGITIEDTHLSKLICLSKHQLEICALIGILGSISTVAKKMSIEIEFFKAKVAAIQSILRFEEQKKFLDWCVLKGQIVQKIAMKSI